MATPNVVGVRLEIVRPSFRTFPSFFPTMPPGLKLRVIAIFGTMAAIWFSFSPCGPIHSSQTDHA